MRRVVPWLLVVHLAAAGLAGPARAAARTHARAGRENPAVLLERVNAAMRALESSAGETEVVVRGEGGEAGGSLELELKFEWTEERSGNGSAQGRVVLVSDRYSSIFRVETRNVDGVEYVKASTNDEWTISPDTTTVFDRLASDLLHGRLVLEAMSVGPTDLSATAWRLEGTVPGEELQVVLEIRAADRRARRMTIEGTVTTESLEVFAANGYRSARLSAETRITGFDVPARIVSPLPVRTTPHGPMRQFRAGSAPVAFPFPAGWTATPPPQGVAAAFASSGGGLLMVAEDDLEAGGAGEPSLGDYAEYVKAVLREQPGFELLSDEAVTTVDGLEAKLLRFTARAGLLHGYRLLYLHEGVIGVNITFMAPRERFEIADPAIRYTFRHLQVVPRD